MRLRLSTLPVSFAVARLDPGALLPEWSLRGRLSSITRTATELSILCEDEQVPWDVRAERGLRALVVEGPIDFATVGLLATLATPLAAAGISIFVLSTFDTDYLLVREESFAQAVSLLRAAGHAVGPAPLG